MRNRFVLVCVAAVLATAVGLADDPKPGLIVIKPRGSGAVPVEPDEAASKYIVIRPHRPGQPPARSPILETKPTATPRPLGPDPVPIATPIPVGQADRPAPAAKAQDPEEGKVVLETWDTAFLKGQKVGYFHVKVREYEKDGKAFVYATKEQKLTVARFGQVVEQTAEDATLETPAGEVLVVKMRQALSKDQQLTITGQVNGRTLTVKGEGLAAGAKDTPWPEGVLGIAKEATLFRDKKPQPGESFSYSYYEGRLNQAVKVTVAAKAVETVAIIQGQPPRKLLRLETAMTPIDLPNGHKFKLPPSTVWCDAETFEPLRIDTDMPSLGGRLVVLRTSKEVALRPVGKVPDLFDVQSIRLDRDVPGIHDRAGVVYRFKVEGDAESTAAFPQDARQQVKNAAADGKAFELHVAAVRGPRAGDPADKPPGEEFLASNFFLDWADEGVKRHARAAVSLLPPTASDWERAKAVERWVRENMKAVEFSQAMATASQVAKTLSGDCTEYAMLAAAMCRANNIPSRTALGLVYASGRDGKPYLAYHMWFEVFADGQWLALDGTLGRGSVGPGHVKITDASWHNERSFAPLLPVLTVLMAQPKVEVGTVTDGR